MKRMREIRQNKKISLRSLSRETGVSYASIWNHEKGKTEMNKKSLEKIAKFLCCNIEELKEKMITESEQEEQKQYTTRCQNQSCPFNKNCICTNDVVLESRAPCFGKELIKPPLKEAKMNNTNYLFQC